MTYRVVATASDSVVSTWELTREALLENGQIIHKATKQPGTTTGTVHSMAWNHTQQVLACGTEEGAITLMLESGKTLEVLKEADVGARVPPMPITSLAWGGRSRYLLTTGQAHSPHLWDLKRKERVMAFGGHEAHVTAVAFAPDSERVASGNHHGEVLLHTLVAQQPVKVLPLELSDSKGGSREPRTPSACIAAAVRSLAFWSARAPTLLAGHRDGVARVWDAGTGACLTSLQGQHQAAISAVMGSPVSDKLLATAGQDRRLVLHDILRGRPLREVKAVAPLTAMAFGPEGDMVLVGLTNGDCSVYDLRKPELPVRTVHAFPGTPVRALAVQQQARRRTEATSPLKTRPLPQSASPGAFPSSEASRTTVHVPSRKAPQEGLDPTLPMGPAGDSAAVSLSSAASTSSSSLALRHKGNGSGPAPTRPLAPPSPPSHPPVAPSSSPSTRPALPPLAAPGGSGAQDSSGSLSSLPLPAAYSDVDRPTPSSGPSLVAQHCRDSGPTAAPPGGGQSKKSSQDDGIPTLAPALCDPSPPAASAVDGPSREGISTRQGLLWRNKPWPSASSSPSSVGGSTPLRPATLPADATVAAAASGESLSRESSPEARLLESKVQGMVDDLREDLARDLRGLHLEMMRTSEGSQAAMQRLVSAMEALVEENRGLRREVQELQQQMEIPF